MSRTTTFDALPVGAKFRATFQDLEIGRLFRSTVVGPLEYQKVSTRRAASLEPGARYTFAVRPDTLVELEYPATITLWAIYVRTPTGSWTGGVDLYETRNQARTVAAATYGDRRWCLVSIVGRDGEDG